MPNHITNILTVQTDDAKVRDILEAVKSDESGIGSVDFNKIIPMPEDIYRGDLGPDERQIYGENNWYDWSCENWGTKWDSYGYNDLPEYENGSNVIRFNTAWSAPHPILKKLSELYPDVIFTHRWADEDFGHNVGERDYHNGQIIGENIPAGSSKEAYEMAADILDIKLNCEESRRYLSADESCYFYLDPDETYELIELFDKPALFSNGRITASEIPKGLYCYDLRSDDDGNGFATIEPKVRVNHAGSVITDFSIDFGNEGYIVFNEDTSPNFLSEHITIGQYMQCDYETKEELTGDMGGMQP